MVDKISDLQDNIIIVTDLHKVKYANRAFFRFFSEYSSLADFNSNVSNLADLFVKVEQYGFVYKNMQDKEWNTKSFDWYEYVIFSANKICKVSIKDAVFSIKISIYNETDYIITLSDITELVSFKNGLLHDLHLKNQELENKLQDKVTQLNRLNKELERRVEEKVQESIKKDTLITQQSKLDIMSNMISMLSHQWKQPLTAINAYIQGLQIKHTKSSLSTEHINAVTSNIVSLTKSLADTIDEFQQFFKPNEHKEAIKLQDILDKAYHLLKYTLNQKSIKFLVDYKFNATVNVYPSRLLQVLLDIFAMMQSILANSIVLDPAIYTSVSIDDDFALIKIKSNGQKVDEEILKQIFDTKVNTKNNILDGNNLYVSKMVITQQLNGIIDIYNDETTTVLVIKVPLVIQTDNTKLQDNSISKEEFEELFDGYNDSIENIQISAKINLLDLFVVLEFFIWFESFLKKVNRLNHFQVSISNIINYLKVYDNPAKLEILEQHKEELFNILGSIGDDLKVLFFNITDDKDICNLDKSLVSSFHQLFVILHRKERVSNVEFFN